MKQAIESVRLSGATEIQQQQILENILEIFPEALKASSAPEISLKIHDVIRQILGEDIDPYRVIKEESNRKALVLYPQLKEKVESSENRLLTAVELAIAGNVIDYGAKNTLNIEQEIERLFQNEFHDFEKMVFDYTQLDKAIEAASSILYLGDNAGEIVFDRVLMEEIPMNIDITFAVRGRPVINDALLEDAKACGLDQRAHIISSGSRAPGTILDCCYKEFVNLFNKAELIISKGQGNYEALCDVKAPIFFLFKAKCPVIADKLGVSVGDIVLTHNSKGGKND